MLVCYVIKRTYNSILRLRIYIKTMKECIILQCILILNRPHGIQKDDPGDIKFRLWQK